MVPGRRGGLATGCATPSKKHPREAQYFVAGAPMRRSVVSRRLSGKKSTFKDFDWAYWEESYAAVKEPFHVPSPLGVEFPHRPGTSPCDAEHPIWEGWAEAIEDARERAAIATENSDPDDTASYLRAVLGEMQKHPRFEQWAQTEAKCVSDYQVRKSRKAKRIKSEVAAARVAFINNGGDVTSSDWIDDFLQPKRGPKRGIRYHRAA
ncbi:MAG: hypothetical protein Q8Q09_02745 [Deltaproteobacteria bacterium]|nr:hypothetical protein [Deltaproteobacteria bacterium]